ncbi:MAG TPA: site-specific integrase, partial [Cyclobacteriaceae bacterium]
MWDQHIKDFANYLKLERSLSGNSIEAYVRDIEKLHQFMGMTHKRVSALKVTSKHLQGFLSYVNEL